MKRSLLSLFLIALCVTSAGADLVSGRATVADTATVIHTWAGRSGTLLLLNQDAAVSVFLGGSGVTTANGFELKAGAGVSLPLQDGEKVYGIVAAGTVRVDKLVLGRIP